jgi:hypothetical protein
LLKAVVMLVDQMDRFGGEETSRRAEQLVALRLRLESLVKKAPGSSMKDIMAKIDGVTDYAKFKSLHDLTREGRIFLVRDEKNKYRYFSGDADQAQHEKDVPLIFPSRSERLGVDRARLPDLVKKYPGRNNKFYADMLDELAPATVSDELRKMEQDGRLRRQKDASSGLGFFRYYPPEEAGRQ